MQVYNQQEMDRDKIQRFKFLFHTLARPDVKTHKDRIFVDSFVRAIENALLVPRSAKALMFIVNKFSDVFEYLYKNRPIIKEGILRKKTIFNKTQYQKIRSSDFKAIENRMFKELAERRDQFVLPKIKFNSKVDILKMFKSTNTHIKLLYMGNNAQGDGIWWTLNNKTYDKIVDIIQNGQMIGESQGQGSDTSFENYFIREFGQIEIKTLTKAEWRAHLHRQGAFFKYTHNLGSMDFTRYQLYNKIDETTNQDNCLLHACKMSGLLTPEQIERLAGMCKNDMLTRTALIEIGKKMNINFQVTTIGSTNVLHTDKKAPITIKLNLVEDHYFINDSETNITSYAINNYEQIKNEDRFNMITRTQKNGKYFNREANHSVSSMQLFTLLLANKETLLTPIEDQVQEQLKRRPKHHNDFNILTYEEDQVKPIEFKDKKDLNKSNIDQIHFDFETTTNGTQHRPYLCSYIKINGETFEELESGTLYGEDCGLQLLNKLTAKKSILFAHNLGGYDINFIFQYTFADNLTEKENRIYGGSSLFYNKETNKTHTIYYKDTYLLINAPLRDCPSMFLSKEEQLTIKKEVMPYDAYTELSVKKESMLITDATHFLDKEDAKQFRQNVTDWNLHLPTNDKYFKHIEYARIYCEQDVRIQYKSFMQFRTWILQICDLDIMNYLTISSIAYDYIKSKGCLDGCYELSGTPREFIQNTVVGGRCMISENQKRHIQVFLEDLDACSLYPSAMSLMGFLMGKPKVLETTDYDIIKNYDGYFLQIEITKIGILRKFPLMSKQDDKTHIRNFENELGIYFVDRIQLEDLIKFQRIEFNVIKGYYFDDGFNYEIQEVVKDLYTKRAEKKAEGNQIEKTYKLLMNSIYGKTIMKPSGSTTIYKSSEAEAMCYICRNINNVVSFVKIPNCDKYKIEINLEVEEHFNAAHIGASVLSRSKRIMNEVICLAEDLNIDVYYQDTDSLHIKNGSINVLSEEYKKLYNKELLGDGLGQFNSDFDLSKDFVKQYGKKTDEPLLAVESYFLAKKVYIDKIRAVIKGQTYYDYHYRMKGIPSSVVKRMVDREYEGNPIKMYDKLFNGEEIIFNLLDGAPKFEKGKGGNFTIKNKEVFRRRICFSKKPEPEEEF